MVSLVGDGGFAMLMAELSTAVFNERDVKVMVLNNDAYGQVRSEQREIGNPVFRFIAAQMIGHTKSIDAYLRALAVRVGDASAPITDAAR